MLRALLCLLLCAAPAFAEGHSPADVARDSSGLTAHIHEEMAYLASDAMRGRGSATPDELAAARYVVSRFRSFGLSDATLQRVPLYNGRTSHNAFALLRGTDPKLARQTILLTAHLDHLGVRPSPLGEIIYPGADDDASGVTAVLELARTLANPSRRPRRSVLFVCFGSEETGGQGNAYFLRNPPVPLSSIVASIEFEMIGRPDPAVGPGQLWLTGWERSNLGPRLAKQGAPLVADPYPEKHFFRRSDNYNIALNGIVAHTIFSYGLGGHYHQPTDDLEHIDFVHLTHAIESVIPAIEWLANTRWAPSWRLAGQPGVPRGPAMLLGR